MKPYILRHLAVSSVLTIALLIGQAPSSAQNISKAWNPDRGTHYVNPIINADYSDPDVCRVGDDYYMTSSSFCSFPGLQILHSTDLVNWEIVGAALRDYPGALWSDERPWEALGHGVREGAPEVPGALEWKTIPQHGNGVWAPAIRFHDGEFYIYCGDPDRGIFMVKTSDPAGMWEEPVCRFEYSLDGKTWTPLPDKSYRFTASPGKWIGAKVGFFCNRHASKNDGGWLRIDHVSVQ